MFNLCIFRRRRRQVLDSGDPLFSLNSIGPGFFDGLELAELYPPPLHHSEGECPIETYHCDPLNPYRSFTGYCNNLNSPNFGKAMTTFKRLMPAVYENGKKTLKKVYKYLRNNFLNHRFPSFRN